MIKLHILLTGATGFIGDHLVHELEKSDHELYILTRQKLKNRANVHYIEWLNEDKLPNLEDLPVDVCINLAGAGLMDEKWTYDRKKVIVNSRIEATSALLSIVKKMKSKPKLWINASAIGAYTSSKSTIYLDTEENTYADNFLGKTVYEWEKQLVQQVIWVFVSCMLALVLYSGLTGAPSLFLKNYSKPIQGVALVMADNGILGFMWMML